MTISLSEALDGVKNSQGWAVNMLMIFWVLLPIVGIFIVTGYIFKYSYNRIRGYNDILPGVKELVELMIIGFKYYIGLLLCLLPCAIILLILSFMAGEKSLIIGILLIAVALFTTVLVYIMQFSFLADFKISSFIDFSRGIAILKSNPKGFLMLLVMLFLAGAVSSALMGLLGLIPLLGIIIGFYINAIVALGITPELYAQYAQENPVFLQYFNRAHNLG